MTNRLIIHAPGLSKASLAGLLGDVMMWEGRISVEEVRSDGNLAADPATVALIAAGGTVVAEVVKIAVQAIFDWLKARSKPEEPKSPPQLVVTIEFTLGGRRAATISDPAQLEERFGQLPRDFSEISRVRVNAAS
jgi:hypothetical protein